MAMSWLPGKLRFGLQAKAIVVLSLVVGGVALAGGWFYFAATKMWLREADLDKAETMGRALTLAVEPDLRTRRYVALDALVRKQISEDGVMYVAVLDRQGRVVASAAWGDEFGRWKDLLKIPVTVSSTQQSGEALLLARPVISRDALYWSDRIGGAVRVVLDTGTTAANLAKVRRRMAIVAGAIIFCGIPLGYLLIWPFMVKPIRRLVAVTRRFGEGDFTARAALDRGDEVGRLGIAFDAMADEVADMRDELMLANAQLERKVADRTAKLQVANQRLRHEMTEKEDFLRAVSHDLNAPLRNIAGMATMISMKWSDQLPEEVIARLQRIQSNVDAETDLITELLELSRITTRPQRRRVVDMSQLIENVAQTFEYELKARNIELRVAEGMPSLYVEKNRIREVFQNLIDNAIKYMDKTHGGRIDISYRRTKSSHEFRVADNGPGIPKDHQQRIFCIFRRVETPATSQVEGKGVGLALVKNVASNHEGRAWVQSQPPEGAVFCVTLGIDNTKPRPQQEQTPPVQERVDDFATDRDKNEHDYHPVGG